MKVKVSERGVYNQKGKRVAVGTVFTIEGGVIPSWLVGKVTVIEDAPAKAQPLPASKTAIKNPAKSEKTDELTEVELARQSRLKEIIEGLKAGEDFTEDGAAKMDAINALVDKGEEKFTAAERDKLIPIAKA